MKCTLKPTGNTSEFELISDDAKRVAFKYSRTQHSIRMRFNDHYGVYVLDEGSLSTRKFSIRNIYGSEIGTVKKGAWRETIGTLHLDGGAEKFSYEIIAKDCLVNISSSTSAKPYIINVDSASEENYMLALIVFSWMQSVSKSQVAEVY
jgi:hypothetical protein